MGYRTISTEVDDGVLTVTLNRPDRLNAFTVDMADELETLFSDVNADDAVRAVVVTGAGRGFCAGMELASEGNVFGLDETQEPLIADMQDLENPAIHRGVRDTGGRVALAIFNCLKPVIAAINGPAVGIGATMTLPMDIRLASEKARIGFVFGRLGIVPEACSTWFLPRIVGLPRALELVYSADILSAEEAKELGLVRAVYPPESLLAEAQALARRLTENRSPVAIALARQMMYRNSAQPHPVEAHRVDSLAMFYTSIGDGKEGVTAFLEKREPEFTRTTATGMPPFYPWW
jgi:enoyl-CoA hydratase/carnithine racemase